ncbi:MAG TPA: hypothetical protein VK879_21345 [Candidatus Sulfomarinibacteraceae bacterium]|nr:hypothetical protein [Candidatus Sulfomarinibacteraceae bacterium]
MDNVNRSVLVGLGAFIIGFFIGLVIFGWGLTPVEWTGGGPQHLSETDQELYLITLARLYSVDNNQEHVQQALGRWDGAAPAVCQLAADTAAVNPPEAQRLEAMAAALNPQGCAGIAAGAEAEEEGGLGGLLIVLLLIVLFVVLLGVILFVLRRPGAERGQTYSAYPEEMATTQAVGLEDDADVSATPIARFQTTYARGHDTYDDSFSIENAQGDFLGECGVGISESIGMDSPKNVTAFEVWLFDKNDIRTVTKVVMSDHAFFDEALKAKLAPKGEPILAREGETIVLETATLIINAEITDMGYGTGSLPPKSFFERFTVELSAWAKEGDFEEPDIQGHIDEMLDF